MSGLIEFFQLISNEITAFFENIALAWRVVSQGLTLPVQFSAWLSDPILKFVVGFGIVIVVLRFIISLV